MTGLVINAGVIISPGVTLNGFVSAGGGGASPLVSGTMTVGVTEFSSQVAGSRQTPEFGFGQLTASPAMLYEIVHRGVVPATDIVFFVGTYGSDVVTLSGINGETDISITINGITGSGTLVGFNDIYLRCRISGGDTFNILPNVGNTLAFSMTIGAGPASLQGDLSSQSGILDLATESGTEDLMA